MQAPSAAQRCAYGPTPAPRLPTPVESLLRRPRASLALDVPVTDVVTGTRSAVWPGREDVVVQPMAAGRLIDVRMTPRIGHPGALDIRPIPLRVVFGIRDQRIEAGIRTRIVA